MFVYSAMVYCAPSHSEGQEALLLFTHLCPSVAYIAKINSRMQRPSVPKFGRKVPHLRCKSHTSFKVKYSKVRVGGGQRQTRWPN